MSDLNAITEVVIGAAIEVHRRLGPGLLETAYRKCLAYELRKRGLEVTEEHPIPVIYCSFGTWIPSRLAGSRGSSC